jgi:hypothetical protein
MIRKVKAVWRGTGRTGTGHLSADSGVLDYRSCQSGARGADMSSDAAGKPPADGRFPPDRLGDLLEVDAEHVNIRGLILFSHTHALGMPKDYVRSLLRRMT